MGLSCMSFCVTKRLVLIGRSKSLFPVKHLSSTQEISSFRKPMCVLWIHSSSFWSPRLFGGGLSTAGLKVLAYIDDWLIIVDSREKVMQKISLKKVCMCVHSHHSTWLQSECEQKQFHSRSECYISESGAKFNYNAHVFHESAFSV